MKRPNPRLQRTSSAPLSRQPLGGIARFSLLSLGLLALASLGCVSATPKPVAHSECTSETGSPVIVVRLRAACNPSLGVGGRIRVSILKRDGAVLAEEFATDQNLHTVTLRKPPLAEDPFLILADGQGYFLGAARWRGCADEQSIDLVLLHSD